MAVEDDATDRTHDAAGAAPASKPLNELSAQIAALRRYRDDLPPHSASGTRRALDERLAALEALRTTAQP